MIEVIEKENVFEIQSTVSGGLRGLFLLLALFPLLAPYELIIKLNWQNYLNVFFLFAAVISLGAMAVSVVFVWTAVAGLNTRLRFDRTKGSLTYSFGAPIVKWQKSECPLDAIVRFQVKQHDWTDGQPSYSFVVHTTDDRRFETGSSWSRDEIENLVERVSAFLK